MTFHKTPSEKKVRCIPSSPSLQISRGTLQGVVFLYDERVVGKVRKRFAESFFFPFVFLWFRI